MALSTIMTTTFNDVANAILTGYRRDKFVAPTRFQVTPYKSTFIENRTIDTRNTVYYEGEIIEYIVKDPFTVALQCAIPFTPEEAGDITVGEVYILGESTEYPSEFLISLSQPEANTIVQKPYSSVMLLEVVLYTPNMPILNLFNFKNVIHPGNACTVNKIRDMLVDGQGITTSISAAGKLRIDANFDYLSTSGDS